LVKKGAGSCQARRLSKAHFENAVIEEIKKRILTPDNLMELVRLVNEDLDSEAADSQALLESVSKGLLETQRRLDRLYDVVETGKLSMDDLAPRIKGLRVHQAVLELKKVELEAKLSDRHVELADKKTVEKQVADMHNLLSESELTFKKAFVRSFIKEIIVTGNEARLVYSLPMMDKKRQKRNQFCLSYTMVGGRGFEPLTSCV
jgi:site-specific DNA recombinase